MSVSTRRGGAIRAIINALNSILWLVNPVLDEIMTPKGKARYVKWFDRNYCRTALEKKYPWLKHYRKMIGDPKT